MLAGLALLSQLFGQVQLQLKGSVEDHVFNTNSAVPDQTPRFTTSDQDIHCLPNPLLSNTKHELVKTLFKNTKGTTVSYLWLIVLPPLNIV